jgi:DNA-binding MarR family transcriptional regulator
MNATEIPRQEDMASLRVLDEIERNPQISQRELSERVGVSLGLTNLLIRKMAQKAWIKIRTVPGRRLLYALTPRGLAEKFRKTRDFLQLSLHYYSHMKESILQHLRNTGKTNPRVAVVGGGELSRIVAEAVREAGGHFADRPDGVDVLVVLEKVSRARKETWVGEGITVIDLA